MAKSYSKLLIALVLLFLPALATRAESSQTIQIRTHFTEIDKPASWLLIIHDADSPAVYPYLFDLTERDNYYLIFTNSRHYRVISIMQFPHEHRKINNYCHLPQGMVSDLSMDLNITGTLSPKMGSSNCALRVFKSVAYPANKAEDAS